MKYILASASPRRKELLEKIGIPFDIIPANLPEHITKTSPSEIVSELAFQKADFIYKTYGSPGTTVIGADTIVVYNGEILGKPADSSEAYDMLSMLSDRTHQVYTGVSLISNNNNCKETTTFYDVTDVTFYPVSPDDLISYIKTGDSLDKAGAYGIQGEFSIHIKSITGDYNNVVGLPLSMLYQMLKELNY